MFPLSLANMLLKGNDWGEVGLFFITVPGSAKPYSLQRWPWAHAPAVQTQPRCWAHIYILAEPNPIICLALNLLFFFHFSSAYSAAFRSAHKLNCRAERGWQMCYCGYFFCYISLMWTLPLIVSLISQPFPHFSPRTSGVTVGIHFLLKEHHQSQQGGDPSRSIISQLTLT